MKNNAIRKLVSNYLDGKLSVQQRARIETWYLLKNEEVSQQEFEPDYDGLNSEIWINIEDKITDDQQIVGKKKRISIYTALPTFAKIGIAATITLVGIFTYLSYNNKNQQEDKFTVSANKDIAPGKERAYLTLADGRRIDLANVMNGKLISENGLEITKTADGNLVYKINKLKNVEPGFNTISTPIGGQYTVVLPDGSKVWLNAGSSLKYPTNFAENGRNVTLTGEGYFEVAHIDGKNGKLPFIVSVNKGSDELEQVKVLGTHFNINAYADEPSVKTTLLQGSVMVNADKGQAAVLKPGQQSKLVNGQIQLQQADMEMAVAWKNGEFVFREDLRSAMRKVARWYDVEIVYDESAPEKLMLGGWMSRGTNISEVLNHIQLTGKVHFKLEGRRVTVSK
ncbi:DUF4974 domain-containing protein [Pedobacter sp. ISL-68]|uniref:FecR family protein n=1 Tax=unclassified Pedobacter TaxID=2628915 RepID=UPI001BE6A4C5|nr:MULTISPECIES: FecR domain-containing protein [unclassified Pedobacter]MBT2560202.1 DUF4974 domain-containing protein [Pedobacter sp. ISL-64]MBT2589181.1 DUF4974 domain-containing protein [Pedobacter sp. ISL-68]